MVKVKKRLNTTKQETNGMNCREAYNRKKNVKKWTMHNFICLVAITIFAGCSLVRMLHEQNEGQKDHNPVDYGMKPPQHSKQHIKYAAGEPGRKYLELDVHWNDSTSSQPVAIVIHGGGWILGSKDQDFNQWMAWYVANHGYVTFSVDYRLIPKYEVQDCIKDVFGAIVWAKKHAAEFGGDPSRVGSVGFSAGGHLSAMAAVAGDKMDLFPPTGNTGSQYDASVLAAVDFYGLYNFSNAPRDVFPIPKWMNRMFYRFVFNGDPDKNAEYGKKISPINYISERTPPQLVVCGDMDSLKLYPQSVEYVEALKKAGRPVEFISVKNADHAFNAHYWTEESQMAHEAMINYLDRYLKRQ